jgi:hypothetical protein
VILFHLNEALSKFLKHYVAYIGVGVMAKMRKKSELPEKQCPICEKPFIWRKKWSKDWENVIYCSERCKRHKKESQTRA